MKATEIPVSGSNRTFRFVDAIFSTPMMPIAHRLMSFLLLVRHRNA
jgi:hypothetical protein